MRPPLAEGPPAAVLHYLDAVTAQVQATFGRRLVAVWSTGSLALGDYRPDRSDLDVMVVVDEPTWAKELRHLAQVLDHAVLPCPAAGLELVVYPRSVVREEVDGPGYLLNLNTGPQLPPVVSLDPVGQPAFWYVLDRAITHQSGWALHGPAPQHVMTPASQEMLLDAVLQSLEEHARASTEHLGDNAVLNACRAVRFAREGRWYAKRQAAARTIREVTVEQAALVRAALESFESGRGQASALPADAVRAFVEAARTTVGAVAGVSAVTAAALDPLS